MLRPAESQNNSFIKSQGGRSHSQYFEPSQLNHSYAQTTHHLSIDDFEVHSLVGQGYFGKVKVATFKNEKKRSQITGSDKLKYVALKVLTKADQVKRKQLKHTFNQKEILLQLRGSAYFPKLYTTFSDEKSLYFCMEFVQGGQLFYRLRKDIKFQAEAIQFYMAQIVSALQVLHKKNIAYRDIKPENILLDGSGHLKLVDFGFAKMVNDKLTYSLCGTPGYIAPQILQKSGHDTRVDIWSLGVLLFELKTGMMPFFDQNPKTVYENILNCKINWQGNFDSLTKDLIKRLLQVDPNLRLTLDQIKEHKFFNGIEWRLAERRELSPPFVPQKLRDQEIQNLAQNLGIKEKKYSDSRSPILPTDLFADKYLEEKNRTLFDNF